MKFYSYLLPIIILLAGCGHKKESPLAHTLLSHATEEVKATNYRKAINLLDQSINISPTPKALCLKATLLCQIGEHKSSVALFNKIINDKKIPTSMQADSKNNCAQAQYNLGNETEAQRLWSELCHDRNYFTPEVAYLNLALLEMNAVTKLQQQNIIDGPVVDRHIKMAQQHLEQALRISKEYVDAQFYLANIYLRKNSYKLARETLIQLLINDPDHEPAAELLKIVERMIVQPQSTRA